MKYTDRGESWRTTPVLITGQMIVIDGGNTLQEYKGPRELYYKFFVDKFF